MFVNFTKNMVMAKAKDPIAIASNGFHDISNAWFLLAMILPFATVMGYAYLFFLKHCARTLTWTLIFASIGFFAALSYYLHFVIGGDETRAESLLGKYTD